ncbi:MAG TPA: response regulator [Bryobacteraceae bacterium]|nr:response regulator [Bryobacteraceae bacterium]
MPIRILIIDDHVDNLELMSYLLKAFGYATLAASDGLEGLKLAGQEQPDLIICDIQLPGIDGFEVAKRVKSDAQLRAIPLVGITALAMVGDRDRVLQAGFDGYIPKPIAPETFVSDIETFLKPGQQRSGIRVAAVEAGEAPRRHLNGQTTQSHRGTILVVDDVAANLELARSIFEPSGFNVRLAADVDSAMESATEHLPDLILSDVNMPRATGFELLLRIKADPRLRPVPVVLITGTSPQDMIADHALAIGATKFLRRPIDSDILLAEIENCLEAARER